MSSFDRWATRPVEIRAVHVVEENIDKIKSWYPEEIELGMWLVLEDAVKGIQKYTDTQFRKKFQKLKVEGE